MSRRSRWSAASAALAAAAALLAGGLAAPAAFASPPEHVLGHVADARLAGSGKLTWWGFHVYDARLYVPARFDAAEPSAQPFALEITYARAIAGRAIADASRDEIARMGMGTPAERERWHAAMARLFPDVAAGKTLTGVHLPGRGARFYANGRYAGAIEDAAFARAFFAIWLDPRTSAPRLREALLREAAIAPGRG